MSRPRVQGPLFSSTTVAERWDGTSWQIVPTPNPPGATFSSLNGVSCPRPNVCFAVGDYANGPEFAGRETAHRALGRDELVDPAEPGRRKRRADAVSCSGLLACTAVGGLGPRRRALAERWDGTGWHVQTTPNPEDPTTELQLTDVSCPLKRTCTAVGWSIPLDGSGLSSLAPRRALVRPGQRLGAGGRAEARGAGQLGSAGCPVRTDRCASLSDGLAARASRASGLGPWPSAASARAGRSCPPRIRRSRRARE